MSRDNNQNWFTSPAVIDQIRKPAGFVIELAATDLSECYRAFPLIHMPSSSIAQILLRIFALNWFLTGFIQVAAFASSFQQNYQLDSFLIQGIVYLAGGILAWLIAPRLSRLLTRRNDGHFNLEGVTEQPLYTAVFLGIGLYFTLLSFGSAFSWIHFFAISKSPDYGFHRESQPSYYDMSETLMTLAAGVFLLFTSKTWARKLTCNQSDKGGSRPAATPADPA